MRVYQGESVIRRGMYLHLPSLNTAICKYFNVCKIDVEFR